MKQILYALLIMTLFASCSKQVDTGTTTTPTDTTTKNTTPPNIMFYNVMDYGNVGVYLNNVSVASGGIAKYYPTGYNAGIVGTNQIMVVFSSDTVINQNVDLLAGKNYSCFVYRVGYNWKISIVKDDLTAPTTGNSEVRVLDFRTQAWFSYIGVNFFSPGNSPLIFNNRNFLDHESYSSYQSFNTMTSGTYTMTLFNTTANLATQSAILSSGKIYTFVLMTNASSTAAQALLNIQIEQSSNN